MPELREVFETTTKQMGEPDVDSWREQVRRQRRTSRNKRLGALAVAAAIGLVAVVVVIRAADDGTEKQPGMQPTPTLPAGTALETGYLIDLNTGEMTQLPKSIADGWRYAVSPDGTMVAYTSGGDMGTAQVLIASLDGTDVQQVTHDQRGAWAPAWSPDGAAIAYTALGDGDVSNIFVLDLATGETSQVTNEKPTTEACLGCGPLGATLPQFSPDGTSIVYEVNRAVPLSSADPQAIPRVSVRIVPVTGGKSVLLVGGPMGALSPDGSTLAVSCGDGFGGGICLTQADGTTNLRALVTGHSYGPNWSPDGARIAYIIDNYTSDKVVVVDVATGGTTFVADGTAAEWLDDHTLIIERRDRP